MSTSVARPLRLLLALLVAFALVSLAATRFGGPPVPRAHAAAGDLVTSFVVPVKAPLWCPTNHIGTSVAFDGTYILYTNWSDSNLYKIDKTGALKGTVPISGVGLGFCATQPKLMIPAMAWDSKRGKLWVSDGSGDGFGHGNSDGIYLLDENTGVATFQFRGPAFDGLSWDPIDDTLWMSLDAQCPIYHYSVTGTLLGQFNCSIRNSGLYVAGTVIYAGSDGDGTIYELDRASGKTLGAFATPGGRDEDLECDSVTFAPKSVMWSKDTYNDTLTAFEAPCGRVVDTLSAVADGSEVALFGHTAAPDNALWMQETTNGSFTAGWQKLLTGGVASRPRAVKAGYNLFVFFRATNNELHYLMRIGSIWGSEQNLGGVIDGSPAVAVDGSGTVIVAVLNSAGNVFVDRLPSGGFWSGFTPLNGVLTGTLGLINYNGDVYLFGLNLTGSVWYQKWTSSTSSWGGWQNLGGILSVLHPPALPAPPPEGRGRASSDPDDDS